MKRLLLVLMIALAVAVCFTACNKKDSETDDSGETVVVVPSATPQANKTLEYDPELFVMDGATLVKYIGNETEVSVPDGTLYIAESAFRGNRTMEKVDLKDTVLEIGDFAFEGCSALKEVSVPKLVKVVGEGCFKNCTELTKATMPTNAVNVGEACYENCSKLESLTVSNSLTVVPDRFCFGCKSLKEINILAALSIGNYAFYECESLVKVNGTAVTTIGDYAFYGCKEFGNDSKNTDAGSFSKDVLSLGVQAFEGTPWLENLKVKARDPEKSKDSEAYVIIGKGVLIYYSGVLKSGTDLTSIKFDTRIKDVGSEAFADFKDTLKTVEFPAHVIRVEKGAFKDFDKLESVTYGKQISAIPEEAFADCDALKNVVIPSGVNEIAASAFENCRALVSVTPTASKNKTASAAEGDAETGGDEGQDDLIEDPETPAASSVIKIDLPASVTSVGDKAFAGCDRIRKVTIGNNALYIGQDAFSGCTSLEDVTIGKKVNTVGVDAFAGTPWFENWTGDDEESGEKQGALIVGEGVLIKLAEGNNFDGYEAFSVSLDYVGDEIPANMYYGDKKLYSIRIPGTVKTISENAFYYAEGLYEVVIEEGVEHIEASAFYGCRNLKRIVLPSTLKTIGDYAFYGCADVKEIIIPEGVESIGKMAFYNCLGIKNAEIPATVKNIGAYAFTNTFWRERNDQDYLVAGDGILIRYNLFEEKSVVDGSLGIKKIAGGSFSGTYRLSEITLPETVDSLDEFAFSGCTTLKKITAKGVKVLGPRAFNQCMKLETVEFAEGYEAADDAFSGCVLLLAK